MTNGISEIAECADIALEDEGEGFSSEETTPDPKSKPKSRKPKPRGEYLSNHLNGEPTHWNAAFKGSKRQGRIAHPVGSSKNRGSRESKKHKRHLDLAGGNEKPTRVKGAKFTQAASNASRRDINAFTIRLCEKYLQRRAFWLAVSTWGLPVEVAGKIYLGVEKRQAENTIKEIREAGHVHAWFAAEVEAGFLSGKIRMGCETLPSVWADTFFGILAGGHFEPLTIHASERGAIADVGGGGYPEFTDIDHEASDYFVSKQFYEREKKRLEKIA